MNQIQIPECLEGNPFMEKLKEFYEMAATTPVHKARLHDAKLEEIMKGAIAHRRSLCEDDDERVNVEVRYATAQKCFREGLKDLKEIRHRKAAYARARYKAMRHTVVFTMFCKIDTIVAMADRMAEGETRHFVITMPGNRAPAGLTLAIQTLKDDNAVGFRGAVALMRGHPDIDPKLEAAWVAEDKMQSTGVMNLDYETGVGTPDRTH